MLEREQDASETGRNGRHAEDCRIYLRLCQATPSGHTVTIWVLTTAR
jgi:hypothetical protein